MTVSDEPTAGHEFSAVAGFTYNFKNQDTQYQNGIDFHVDWGISQFLSKQFFVGLVGYGYQQITDDFGQHPQLGGFRSRVLGIGPQVGFLFPVGDMRGSQPERLWRICRREPAVGMECLADVRGLSNGSHQHGDANAPGGDEVAVSY